MFEVEITPDIIALARKKAEEMGELRNSITEGEGNLAGFIGEIICAKWLFGDIKNTYDYDIVLKDGTTYDVKTKRCTSPPKNFYECSIAAYNTKQKCDKYIFVRVLYKNGKFGSAWILGEKLKHDYFSEAKFLKKGQIDPSNNFTVKADCYNMAIKNLNPLNIHRNLSEEQV